MKFQSLLFTMLVGTFLSAQTFYVNSFSGDDSNNGTSSATPFKTFTKAFASLANPGSHSTNIIWAEGVFDWNSVNETGDGSNGFVLNKNVTINGLSNASNTIFQSNSSLASSTKRVFQIATNITVLMNKCTVRYGSGTEGGGIEKYGVLYMYNSIITNNKATDSGAGIDTKGFCRIENTQISNNLCNGSTGMGAGANRNYNDPNGSAPNASKGLYLINCTITNNTITASTGYLEGAGVFIRRGYGSITNCTITNNICSGDLGSSTHGIGVDDNANIQLKNNIIVGNCSNSNTWGGDLGTRSGSGTLTDNGGNIFGRPGYYPGGLTPSATTWIDASNGSPTNGSFTLTGTSTSGVLNLSSGLANNGSLNGMTLSFGMPSIAINNGVSGTNGITSGQSVSIPTTDQRGVTRSGNADIGAFEGEFINWVGTTTNPLTASNWNPATVPSATSQVVIQNSASAYPSYTTAVSYSDLTIDATATVALQSSGQLTLSGALTNNGTFTIESGGTFIQGTSVGGSGSFNIKQALTNCTNDGSAPTGRYWYMGVPLNGLTRVNAFGSASNLNRLWSWSESAQAWSSQITDATALSPTTGYVFRTGADVTLTFTGTSLYSADASITGLTNTTGSFDGCHLMSNPYTAYLDWEAMIAAAGTSNLATTMCVRSYNTSSSQMVYDTYNATGDVAVQNSSYAVTRYIAPMQSFWITVNPSTTGALSMTKAMLTHQPTAPGLKDLTSFPAFARLNLVDGSFTDQVVVYTDAEANAELEEFDSKKFFLPNVAQVYCKVGNDKLVINALKKGKAQTSAPLTVELPSTKVYKFEMAESFVDNGLVILEDRQEGIFQDMGINPTYEFFGNSGVTADRFVLHFQLPNGTSNEGQAGVEDLTSSQIAIISNQNGSILVSLSADLTATGEVQILDAAGRLIQTTSIKGQDTKLQITEGTGVYFVRVSTPMKSETKKVLVY